MIYKRCSHCGKRIETGSECPCIKERYKKYRKLRNDKKEQVFYSSGIWIIKRDKIKDKFKGIDIYSYFILGKIEFSSTVHHIEPIKDNWNRRLDDDNLIPLTDSNHRKIHKIMDNSEIDKEKIQKILFELVKRFENEILKVGGI